MSSHFKKAAIVANKVEKRSAGQRKLNAQHRQLLEFLLAYPDVINRFLEAGLEEILMGDIAGEILGYIAYLVEEGIEITPERLLESIHEPHKSLVYELLVSASQYSEEAKEDMTSEIENWLRRKSLEKNKARLVRQINEAQQQGDEILMMQLLEKKKELDALDVR
jgi:hypothetical protein